VGVNGERGRRLAPLDAKTLDRLKGFRANFPPRGFDPLTADDETLARFRFPPRPPARTLAARNWERAFQQTSQKLAYPTTSDPTALFLTAGTLSRKLGPRASPAQEASTNWSGAYVRPAGFAPLTLVQGRWTTPLIKRPAPSAAMWSCSVWIGLDGRDPATRFMPQTGIMRHRYVTGPPNQPSAAAHEEQAAWWQWWERDDPLAEQIVIDPSAVRCDAGDAFYAQVQDLGTGAVNFFIKNETTGQVLFFDFFPPGRPLGRRVVEGRTADWIVERQDLRPAVPELKTFPPLANYGAVEFRDCVAGTAGAAPSEQRLEHARLIRMNDWNDTARPGRIVSRPTRRGGVDRLDLAYVE
jgi:hypothetical protein